MTDYRVNREASAQKNIFEQMGNIYSEVGRSFKAKSVRENDRANDALVRALDLFDATIEVLIAKKSPRAREVLRAKDQYLSAFYENTADEQAIDKYFMQYAVAARLRK